MQGADAQADTLKGIYYVDFGGCASRTLEDAIAQAQAQAQGQDACRSAAGFDQAALDAVARLGFASSAFEDRESASDAVPRQPLAIFLAAG
ncbi:hypothetical protein [Paraburkholderia sp. A2RO-4L]|uniref:hypothetical protein n=1 Tax=Paraburkholderia sp. A2RO-4L TaxID=3028374 RepID=UPI003DA83401